MNRRTRRVKRALCYRHKWVFERLSLVGALAIMTRSHPKQPSIVFCAESFCCARDSSVADIETNPGPSGLGDLIVWLVTQAGGLVFSLPGGRLLRVVFESTLGGPPLVDGQSGLPLHTAAVTPWVEAVVARPSSMRVLRGAIEGSVYGRAGSREFIPKDGECPVTVFNTLAQVVNMGGWVWTDSRTAIYALTGREVRFAPDHWDYVRGHPTLVTALRACVDPTHTPKTIRQLFGTDLAAVQTPENALELPEGAIGYGSPSCLLCNPKSISGEFRWSVPQYLEGLRQSPMLQDALVSNLVKLRRMLCDASIDGGPVYVIIISGKTKAVDAPAGVPCVFVGCGQSWTSPFAHLLGADPYEMPHGDVTGSPLGFCAVVHLLKVPFEVIVQGSAGALIEHRNFSTRQVRPILCHGDRFSKYEGIYRVASMWSPLNTNAHNIGKMFALAGTSAIVELLIELRIFQVVRPVSQLSHYVLPPLNPFFKSFGSVVIAIEGEEPVEITPFNAMFYASFIMSRTAQSPTKISMRSQLVTGTDDISDVGSHTNVGSFQEVVPIVRNVRTRQCARRLVFGPIYFVMTGSYGDRIPLVFWMKELNKLGFDTVAIQARSLEEGLADLHAVEQGRISQVTRAYTDVAIRVALHDGYIIAPREYTFASATWSLMPPSSAIRPPNWRMGPLMNSIVNWLSDHVADGLRITARPGILHLPRSANGDTLLVRSTNTDRPIPFLVAMGSTSLPYETEYPKVEPGDHYSQFERAKVVICHGGAGTVETIGMAGARAVSLSSVLDRDYFDPTDAAKGVDQPGGVERAVAFLYGDVTASIATSYGVSWAAFWFNIRFLVRLKGSRYVWTVLYGLYTLWSVWVVLPFGLGSSIVGTLCAALGMSVSQGAIFGTLLAIIWPRISFFLDISAWDLGFRVLGKLARVITGDIGAVLVTIFGLRVALYLEVVLTASKIVAMLVITLPSQHARHFDKELVILEIVWVWWGLLLIPHTRYICPARELMLEGTHRLVGDTLWVYRVEELKWSSTLDRGLLKSEIPTKLQWSQVAAAPRPVSLYGAVWNCHGVLLRLAGGSGATLGLAFPVLSIILLFALMAGLLAPIVSVAILGLLEVVRAALGTAIHHSLQLPDLARFLHQADAIWGNASLPIVTRCVDVARGALWGWSKDLPAPVLAVWAEIDGKLGTLESDKVTPVAIRAIISDFLDRYGQFSSVSRKLSDTLSGLGPSIYPPSCCPGCVQTGRSLVAVLEETFTQRPLSLQRDQIVIRGLCQRRILDSDCAYDALSALFGLDPELLRFHRCFDPNDIFILLGPMGARYTSPTTGPLSLLLFRPSPDATADSVPATFYRWFVASLEAT